MILCNKLLAWTLFRGELVVLTGYILRTNNKHVSKYVISTLAQRLACLGKYSILCFIYSGSFRCYAKVSLIYLV